MPQQTQVEVYHDEAWIVATVVKSLRNGVRVVLPGGQQMNFYHDTVRLIKRGK